VRCCAAPICGIDAGQLSCQPVRTGSRTSDANFGGNVGGPTDIYLDADTNRHARSCHFAAHKHTGTSWRHPDACSNQYLAADADAIRIGNLPAANTDKNTDTYYNQYPNPGTYANGNQHPLSVPLYQGRR
jgi:hypothetical protein